MPDIWSKLDEHVFEARWYIVLLLIGASLVGGGLYLLSDRQQLPIQSSRSSLPTLPTSSEVTGLQVESGPININTATKEELESLPGIGPVIAGRIIDYRKTNGPFKRREDLLKVKGIGPKTFADLKDKITLQ